MGVLETFLLFALTVPLLQASQAPVAQTSADVTVTYPVGTLVVYGNYTTSSNGGTTNYSWVQESDWSNSVILTAVGSEDIAITCLQFGRYVFDFVVANSYGSSNDTVVVDVGTEKWISIAALIVSGVAAFGTLLSIIGGLLGTKVGYSLGVFNFLQSIALLLFLKTELPGPFAGLSSLLGWSLVHFAIPWQTSPVFPGPPGRGDAPTSCPAGLEGRYNVVVEGNVLVSLTIIFGVLLLHGLLLCCSIRCRKKSQNSDGGFPKIEHGLLQFLFSGLALNAAFSLKALKLNVPAIDFGYKSLLALLYYFFVILFSVLFPTVLFFQLRVNIRIRKVVKFEGKPSVKKGPEKPPRRNDPLLTGQPSKSELEEGPRPVGWHPTTYNKNGSKNDPAVSFHRNYGCLYENFSGQRSAYLFIPFELFEKLFWAATLVFITGSPLGIAAFYWQISLLILLTLIRFVRIAFGKPFICPVQNFFQGAVAFFEILIMAALIVSYTGVLSSEVLGMALVGFVAFVVAFFFLDHLRVFVKGILTRTRPTDIPALVASPSSPELEQPREVTPSEMGAFQYQSSVFVSALGRTFNIYTPGRGTPAFSKRFKDHDDILKQGFFVDADPTSGNVLFWFNDPNKSVSSLGPTQAQLLIQDRLRERKMQAINLAQMRRTVRPMELFLWDDPDISLTGAREEQYEKTGQFPEYDLEEYANRICATDGKHKEGFWRGHRAEIVGYEFDAPAQPVCFGGPRIAACLDRVCNVAKMATPNFLRVFDYTALRSAAGPTGRQRVRVVAVSETTDIDFEDFLERLTLAGHPAVVEDLMRGIIAQVVISLNAAQNSAFGGLPLDFRHNDLKPANLSLCLSDCLLQRLEHIRRNEPTPRPEPIPGIKKYVYYQVAETFIVERSAGGPNQRKVPEVAFVVDLDSTPLVKISNCSASSCRVVNSRGQLSKDPIRGHLCPQTLPNSSYDLRFFAIHLHRLMQKFVRQLGPCPLALRDFLSHAAGVDITTFPANATIPVDGAGPLCRTILDHPFLHPLKSTYRDPPACIANTYYYIEHPLDPVVPHVPIPIVSSPMIRPTVPRAAPAAIATGPGRF